ncbi:ATP-binding cassette domain-containing protein [Gordonia sp. SID5947]|uniref:dipeptide/oligopeptide/nickel ABC transporter permease/ATP-binding protein n=1 Tax=Gordonia sp. SID5947 TaxID=2690315 RepID=UPI00136ED813|nr:dipeptide/oligopeptide/nickel ABC transporter permease/ATP-binding protein [Gordonia sp. SID5947]MYR07629.1 ATP-binding cassette domain-containing protein [Gordonia sp. SID5947]
MMTDTKKTTSEDAAASASAPSGLWRRFRRRYVAVGAAAFLILLCVVAALAPIITPYDPDATDFASAFSGFSSNHWLGADQLGRDTLSRLIEGTQIAMIAGLEAITVAVVLGVPIGLVAGYAGGITDRILMRLVDVFLSLPGMLVALAIIAALGPGLVTAMFAVGILFAIRIARLVRGSVLSTREELYVTAAQLSGAPAGTVMMRYVLPNVAIPLLVEVALYFGVALLIEAMLSFLGVGVQPPQATWGVMLSEARTYFYQQPLLAVVPGVMITLTVLAFNLVADGLAASVNPRSARPRPKAAPAEAVPNIVEPVEAAAPEAVLSLRNLRVSLPGDDGPVPVLRGVSLDVCRGEVVGLVGESGSGKSMTSLASIGLLPPGAAVSGHIRCGERELVGAPEKAWRDVRGARIAMVFQEPGKALNPAMTVGRQLEETVRLHRRVDRRAARAEAIRLLARVGVPEPERRVEDYPHQFSGGMAQRVVIAIALACEPDMLIADEPTTALDVTTQAQVLDLLIDIKNDLGVGILFITHDLGVVADICDRAAVMYAGEIVETASVDDLFTDPRHPYTRALLTATPDDGADLDRLPTIPGQVPRPGALGDGCVFAGRCSAAVDGCGSTEPPFVRIGDGRQVRCLLVDSAVPAIPEKETV